MSDMETPAPINTNDDAASDAEVTAGRPDEETLAKVLEMFFALAFAKETGGNDE